MRPSQIEFPITELSNKVIIAMKGLPCTGKSELARLIGEWAGCQVLYIDDFLETLSFEKGYTVESPPSEKEAEHLHRLALEALYKVAKRHLNRSNCVVIKSRLSSTFEFLQLTNLFDEIRWRKDSITTIIIIECRIKNVYRWRSRLESKFQRFCDPGWYNAKNWREIEDCDDRDDQDRDLSFLFLLMSVNRESQYPPQATWLVLDLFDDLNVDTNLFFLKLTPAFQQAIRYLLDWHGQIKAENMYKVRYVALLQFDELRRYLLEKEISLSASRKRSKYLCTSKTSVSSIAGSCVFELQQDGGNSCCSVCEKRLVSGQPAYTCHFCILALHKSCAEHLYLRFLKHVHDPAPNGPISYSSVLSRLQEKHSCKSCMEQGQDFSHQCKSCLFQTHLKYGALPTITYHECHELHFLSLQLSIGANTCKACGIGCFGAGYVCHFCKHFYHIKCVFLPGNVKHDHGGYEHVMKLMYSHDGMETEDDDWCNVCYKDMDPQAWFYSCQECPYYVTHGSVICAGKERILEAVRKRDLPIRFSEDPEENSLSYRLTRLRRFLPFR